MIAFADIREALTPKQSPQLYDVPLLYCMLMLIGVGFVMVTSASMPTAERLFDNPYHIIIRHGMFLIWAFSYFGLPLTCLWIGGSAVTPIYCCWFRFAGFGLIVAVK